MEPLVVIGLGSFGILLALVTSLARSRPRDRAHALERALAAQAEIEDSDIDQMIEARNDIRRRRGLPEIGDDLVGELARGRR